MSGRLWLFSSIIERDAAFPDGIPSNVHTALAGVGLIDAAIMTAESIERFRPDEIVYLGTCGLYPGRDAAIGNVVAATHVCLASGDTTRKEMRIPQLLPAELSFDSSLTERVVEEASGAIKQARVVCTLGVTENDVLAETLAVQGDVENLEVFSVLRAAGSIPTAAILAVTNIVGEGGGKSWVANYRSMMAGLVSMFRL